MVSIFYDIVSSSLMTGFLFLEPGGLMHDSTRGPRLNNRSWQKSIGKYSKIVGTYLFTIYLICKYEFQCNLRRQSRYSSHAIFERIAGTIYQDINNGMIFKYSPYFYWKAGINKPPIERSVHCSLIKEQNMIMSFFITVLALISNTH